MSKSEKRKTQIVVMDTHFLYLPLFYAKHKQFFGFIPNEYDVEIIPSAAHTDDSAYHMLMDTSSASNAHIDLAVADPGTVFKNFQSLEGQPAILAALISNTAFWAVDRRSRQIVLPKDLAAFESIIAFKPGTTSHSIAQRIFKDAKKPYSILPVNPQQELVKLQETVNTVALSPDILGIDHLVHHSEGHFNIDLNLGTTQEFSNVFTTALLSRRDFVDAHRDLIFGLLKALQLSLFFVKVQHPDLIQYTSDKFGDSKERVTSALKRAEHSNVFPVSIEVSEATWMNAAKISCEAGGLSSFGAEQQKEARRAFQQTIEPYLNLVRRAVNEIFSQVQPPISKQVPAWRPIAATSAAILLCLVVGAMITKWCHWMAYGVFAVCTILAITISTWLKLKRGSATWFYHWFLCTAFQVVILAWLSPELQREISVPTYIPLGVAVTLLLAEWKLVNDQSEKKTSRVG